VGGEGADELFGGYPRYRWLRRAERIAQTLPAGAAASLASLARRAPHPRVGHTAGVLQPRPMLARHVDWVTAGRAQMRDRLYGPALRNQVPRDRVIAELEGRLDGAADMPVMRRMMMLDQLHWLPDDVLVKADRAGMRVSLEVRTPYLNRELAEFAGTVSERVHAERGGKALLRALLDQVAPQAARRRPKTAFRAPAADWLRGPLAGVMDRQVSGGSAFAEGWFDRKAAHRVLMEHQAGTRDASNVLWPMLAFGLWLDRLRGQRLD
jgi:asparagine synthase (glutamine-hydrolysing)